MFLSSTAFLNYILVFSIVTSSLFIQVKTANILFLFAGGNLSHKISIWPFALALAQKGHNITFISSAKSVDLPTHPKLIDIIPEPFLNYTQKLYNVDRFKERLTGNKWDLNSAAFRKLGIDFCKIIYSTIDGDPNLGHILETPGNFDLVVINAAFNECGVLIAKRLRAKFIIYSSTTIFPWHFGIYGAPIESSSIPDIHGELVNYPPSFLDRIKNHYKYYLSYGRNEEMSIKMEEMYEKRYGEKLGRYIEEERKASLVFLNSHPSTDFPHSLPPLFISIGGTQCWDPVGKIPLEFDEFMRGAEDGVILITFGSTIDLSTMDNFYINIFFNTMKKYPKIRFIWRWKGEPRENRPKNLLGGDWLPQREILDHNKTIGFMTHGGLNSIIEATSHGVPLIVFPLFADQDYNAIRVKAQELGVVVEPIEFSQELMDNAVYQIINNKNFKKNMMTRSRMFKDRPRSPSQEAIYWTEFVLRQNDTSAFRPMLLQQSFFVRTSMDVHFAVFSTIVFLPLAILFLLRKICSF